MAENSKIEWTTHTFNPWRGCTKVSPGCAYCYAETLSKRNPAVLGEWGPGRPRVRASAAMWKQPLKWNAAEDGKLVDHAEFVRNERPRVFCASLADWLDHEVPIEWLADLLALIHATPNLDWLLLSKRPQNWEGRMAGVYTSRRRSSSPVIEMVEAWIARCPPPNVWIGTSVEDQTRAYERIPELLKIPAKVRFLSCEPLLGPVRLDSVCPLRNKFSPPTIDALEGSTFWPDNDSETDGPRIHWVIAGGESGPHARPMHPDWIRGLRDQCAAAKVPFLFKQWGEWGPCPIGDGPELVTDHVFNRGPAFDGELWRVGKAKAGRTLDGRIHHEFTKP